MSKDPKVGVRTLNNYFSASPSKRPSVVRELATPKKRSHNAQHSSTPPAKRHQSPARPITLFMSSASASSTLTSSMPISLPTCTSSISTLSASIQPTSTLSAPTPSTSTSSAGSAPTPSTSTSSSGSAPTPSTSTSSAPTPSTTSSAPTPSTSTSSAPIYTSTSSAPIYTSTSSAPIYTSTSSAPIYTFTSSAPIYTSTSSAPTPSTSTSAITHSASAISTQSSSSSSTPGPHERYDIGQYVGRSVGMSSEEKYDVIKNAFVPGKTFDYPFTTRISRGKEEKRYLKREHFERFAFLTYSKSRCGVFCRYCVLFAPECIGNNKGQKLGKLVVEPLDNYARLLGNDGYLHTHTNNTYHKDATAKADAFIERMDSPNLQINNILDTSRNQQATENRERLVPIIKSIVFCGRNGLPLRGHRDHGPLTLEEPDENDGNFRSLLRFRADSGDKTVNSIVNAPKNATYISPKIQNEIIDTCGVQIIDKLMKRVNESKYFSVLADETTDASRIEQLNMCFRYVYNSAICEDFVTFVPVYDLSGKALANTILTEMKKLDVDTTFLVGQGYDGASAMSGQFKGVQAEIKKHSPTASYVHCSSHCLNLSLSKASNVQAIRNCVGTMSETITFINSSAKRLNQFVLKVGETSPESRVTRLKRLCETRWVERHDSVVRFHDMYEEVHAVLDEITKWKDATASSKARSLSIAISRQEFVIGLLVLQDTLAVTKPLAESLQKPNQDLISALDDVNTCIDVLKEKRNRVDEIIKDITREAETLIDEPLTMPRTNKRQTHRSNVDASTPQEYYSRSILIPFLDEIISDLLTRFSNHNAIAFKISALLPTYVNDYNFSDLEDIIEFYQPCCPFSKTNVRAEYERWKLKWKNETDVPTCPAAALARCKEDFYPCISTYLKIYCVLPVTTASAERTFSTLKYLKSYLRTTMGEDRLNGLARMFVHRDISLDVTSVIDKFAMKARKCDFAV